MVTGNRPVAFIAGLLIAANPLYLSLSVTFMMDVHFYALFVMSICFYFQYFRKNSLYWFMLAFLSTLFGMFLRQFAIVVPITFLALEIISRKKTFKQTVALHSSTVLLVLAAYFFFNNWLESEGMLPSNFRSLTDLADVGISEFGWRIFIRTGLMLVEAGLWLFPMLLFLFVRSHDAFRKRFLWLAILGIVFLIPMVRVIGGFPAGNILYNLGLGPVTTRDVYVLGLSKDLFNVQWVILLFRVLGLAGGIMLVVLLINKLIQLPAIIKSGNRSLGASYNLAGFIALILYAGIVMINFTYFDRYILPLLPLTLMCILPVQEGKEIKFNYTWLIPNFLYIAGLLVFGTLATVHYLEWNKTRWELIRDLEAGSVDARIIDGGHEYNGWTGKDIDREGRWDLSGQKYVISFTRLEGYEVYDERSQINPLTGKRYSIYTLKKADNYQQESSPSTSIHQSYPCPLSHQ
jgi:hypothetical protein